MDQHNNAGDQLIHVNGIHIPSTSSMNSIIGIDTCTFYTQNIFFLNTSMEGNGKNDLNSNKISSCSLSI